MRSKAKQTMIMKRMNSLMDRLLHVLSLCAVCCTLMLAASCKSASRAVASPAAAAPSEVPLTPDQERKFEYFLIEASRLKLAGDYAAALEMYEHCLSIDPTSATVLYEMASFYTVMGLQQKAGACFERAVELNPDNFWYKQTLAAFYQQSGQTDKAIAVYEAMAAQFPKRSEPLMTLVSLYGQKEDYPNVVHALDRLEGVGLINRIRGSGSYVTQPKLLHGSTSWHEGLA